MLEKPQHRQRHAVLAVSDMALVLDRGTVVHSEPAQSLRDNPELLEKILGGARLRPCIAEDMCWRPQPPSEPVRGCR
ncbi:MAG: hypothetical protein LH617_04860 [Ramlibacter sp.]|nr:hypothetical protein [Ramlibacter sp.]